MFLGPTRSSERPRFRRKNGIARMMRMTLRQGPPLILIHGYGGSMWQWEYQQTPLAAHFRVITPDLIGSGLSDKPDLDYRPEELIESVRGLMDRLGLPTATLVGNSMGGGVAIGMALTHPELVDRLVLIDGLPDHVHDRLASPLMRRAIEIGRAH